MFNQAVYICIMAEKENSKKNMPKLSELKKVASIFRYILPYKWLFILNLVLLVITSLSSLAVPYFTGDLIDVAQGANEEFKSVNQVALIMGGVLLGQSLLSFVRIIIQTKFSERSIVDIRSDLYQKIITLPTSFFNQSRVGDLTSRLSNDVTTLSEAFSLTLPQFIRQLFTMITGITVLTILNWKLTLIMLGTIPVIIVFALIFGRFIKDLSKDQQDKLAEANTVVEETLQAVQSVKAFTNELYESVRYKKSITEVYKLALKGSYYRAGFIVFMTLGFLGAIVFILWQASVMLNAGDITTGDFVKFIMLTVFIAGSIAGFGESLTSIQKTIGATERVEELLREESELNINETDGKPFEFHSKIQFKHVNFSYPGKRDTEVLSDINFEILKGQKVALVGSSGAGKSTIAQLLLRFYNLSDGDILIDNNSSNQIDLSDYRKHIGFVPQEVLLFGGTIRENIAYGKQNPTDKEIKRAAEFANAWEFIERFPDGLETIVGERGVQLSGGQRQRIAIARALLKNPPILILDEATSALDAESEHLVQEALENLMENRTTLIIAHRLSTVRHADQIIVLKNGEIIEQGNHETLIKKEDGAYANLVELQLR